MHEEYLTGRNGQPRLAAPTAGGGYGYVPAPASGPDLKVKDVLAAVWRRKWLMLLAIVLVTGLAVVYAKTVPTVYSARADVLLESRQPQVVDLGDVLGPTQITDSTVENEMRVITSRSFAREVVERLELYNVPEFNPALNEDAGPVLPSWFTDPVGTVGGFIDGQIEALRAALSESPATDAGRPGEVDQLEEDYPHEAVVNRLLGAIEVEPIGRSEALRITAEAEDPRLAAEVANGVARQYIAEQLEVKREAARRAAEWLRTRTDELRGEVVEREAAVEQYRTEAGLIQGQSSGLAEQELSELNSELIRAKAAEAEAEARYRKALQLTPNSGVEGVAAGAMASDNLRELRGLQAQLLVERADLSNTYGPRHPQSVAVEAELANVREQIRAEIARVQQNLRDQLDVARAHRERLEAELTDTRQRGGTLNAAAVKLRALEREAEAARLLYEKLLNRLAETSQQEDLQTPGARLLSAATVPTTPARPKVKQIVALGFVLSCFTGLLLVWGVERLERGFLNTDQLRDRLGVRPIGVVPALGSLARAHVPPHAYLIERPRSAFGEAIRTLRTGLLTPADQQPPRSVAFTSSIPGEGKTTLCSLVGRQTALAGQSVVIVDCDLRLPRLHRVFNTDRSPGVADLLKGRCSLDECIKQDPEHTGLHIIPAGDFGAQPIEVLRSPAMAEVLRSLEKRYDVVLIDTPPLLPISDGIHLARIVDAVAFVVLWRTARREAVEAALGRLPPKANVNLILNNVDVRELAHYGSSNDAQIYRGSYQRYYVD